MGGCVNISYGSIDCSSLFGAGLEASADVVLGFSGI